MALDPGTYDVEYKQGGDVISTGELTLDGTPVPSEFQAFITSLDYGISPSGNSTTDRQNIQAFVDFCADNNVTGILEAGTWQSDNTIILKDGLRLMGRGMHRTIINCPTADWQGSGQFRALELDVTSVENTDGFYLADLQVIGADKNRVDDGPLIRLEAGYDMVIERVMVVDASSYGIFVAGYGVGSFTNDITSSFWNSSFRTTVRDCLAIRGQIGFGTEGGAENVLFQRCVALGNEGTSSTDYGLHGYRSASGYNVWYDRCKAFGYRNGFLLDRYRNMMVSGCYVRDCRNGIAVGSFYSTDPEISHDLRIVNNYFHCITQDGTGPAGITDTFLSNRQVHGVVIMGNVFSQGSISLFQVRQAVIMGNTSMQSGTDIDTNSNVTGLVSNNAMTLSNSASGVDDGGNNNFYTGY